MSSPVLLVVLLDGRHVADIRRTAADSVELRYTDAWRSDPQAHPLSLGLPLTAQTHNERALLPFLWGLLPDNATTLRRLGRSFGVSTRNPVALLREVGADCAGAVQLLPPDRVAAVAGAHKQMDVEWLDDAAIAAELRELLQTGLPHQDERDVGRFSLAGAQPKTALIRHEGRWGRPFGRTPTTHILKPPSPDFPGLAENEHLCQQVAQALGLRAANTEVLRFDGAVTIAVERFDRLWDGVRYRRLHQEDVCQALGVLPTDKYEADGGPGLLHVLRLIDESSRDTEDDRQQFLDAAILNWVLAATDAHAKNFSLLHVPGGGVRLAPLYDTASFLPYATPELHRVKLAMRVNNEYSVRRITRADWIAMGRRAGMSADFVMERLESVISRTEAAVRSEASRALAAGLDRRIISDLETRIVGHAHWCANRILGGRDAAG